MSQTTATTDPTFAAINNLRRRSDALAKVSDCWRQLDAFEAVSAAEGQALDELCCTRPTTIAGARAAIERVMAIEDGQGVPAARAYIECLLASPLLALVEREGGAMVDAMDGQRAREDGLLDGELCGVDHSAAHRSALELAKGAQRQAGLEIAAHAVGEERIEGVSRLAGIVVQKHAHRVGVGVVSSDAADALKRGKRDSRNCASRPARWQSNRATRADP